MKSLIKDGDHERHNIFAECVCGHSIVNWQWHKWRPGDDMEDDNVFYQMNYYLYPMKADLWERIKSAYKLLIGNSQLFDDFTFTRKQVEYIKDGLIQALEDTKPKQLTEKKKE